jgi:hypothetical protein
MTRRAHLAPAAEVESRLRWREKLHKFTVAERTEVAPGDPWGDQR